MQKQLTWFLRLENIQLKGGDSGSSFRKLSVLGGETWGGVCDNISSLRSPESDGRYVLSPLGSPNRIRMNSKVR